MLARSVECFQKSHGEPRPAAYTWLRISTHGERLARLTLKAGRNGGVREVVDLSWFRSH
jgi:hypothetical protein